MEVTELKLWTKEDSDNPEVLSELSGLQLAAEEYMTNAGVNKDYTKELYKLAIKTLVNHWNDNRMITTDKSLNNLPYSLPAMITQLKYTQTEVEVV